MSGYIGIGIGIFIVGMLVSIPLPFFKSTRGFILNLWNLHHMQLLHDGNATERHINQIVVDYFIYLLLMFMCFMMLILVWPVVFSCAFVYLIIKNLFKKMI